MKGKEKSFNRQLKRRRLKWTTSTRITKWETNAITGGISPIFEEVPILLKKTNRGRYIPVN